MMFLTLAGVLGFVTLVAHFWQPRREALAAVEARTQAVVAATNAFLDSLTAGQSAKVQFGFTPQKAAALTRFTLPQ
jgi:hypothetical protein